VHNECSQVSESALAESFDKLLLIHGRAAGNISRAGSLQQIFFCFTFERITTGYTFSYGSRPYCRRLPCLLFLIGGFAYAGATPLASAGLFIDGSPRNGFGFIRLYSLFFLAFLYVFGFSLLLFGVFVFAASGHDASPDLMSLSL